MSENTKESILKELEFMFEQAEDKGLWFYSRYQQLWFSPNELRENHNEDRYVWGAVNWMLRDPEERLEELYNLQESVENQIDTFKRRMSR